MTRIALGLRIDDKQAMRTIVNDCAAFATVLHPVLTGGA